MKDMIDKMRIESERKKKEEEEKKKQYAMSRPKSQFTTKNFTAGFTSSAVTASMNNEYEVATDEEIYAMKWKKARKLGKKGYVQITTNMGTLNCEIHCDLVPRTSYNFLSLCIKGYYDNTIFHRSIKNFMIQGGDPTGTGTGGDSIFGGSFADEFFPTLQHTGKGVLSMANSGKDTNKSQFFITYKSCQHLDNKHSVFGRVVGGLQYLTEMEKVPTNSKDKPIRDIIIKKTIVIQNPFEEVENEMKQEIEEENKKIEEMEIEKKKKFDEMKKKRTILEKQKTIDSIITPNPISSSTSKNTISTQPIKRSTSDVNNNTIPTKQLKKPIIGAYIAKKNTTTQEDLDKFLETNNYTEPKKVSKPTQYKLSNFSDW
ncbi:hypothetical protein WA158_007786 [Blastocystis sp. Blastoise]